MNGAHIELLPSRELNGPDRRRVAQLAHEVDWGTPLGVEPLHFGNDDCWRVLLRKDDQIVSTLEILEREVVVGRSRLVVAGIAGLMTGPTFQGHGYASAAMRRAATFLTDERAMNFALLVCWPSRVPFYERLSWRVHHGEVLCQQPSGTRVIDTMRVMVLDGTQCPLPSTPVDLLGLPW